jgi:urease accessory protein
MASPTSSEMAAGMGVLEFARTGARTVVTRACATSPLRLLNPRNHGPGAWVYTSTYGGGLVGGDAIDLQVHVGGGATAFLSTQASTKVYRSLRPCSQTLLARVESDGLLAIIPDPVVCFAGSRFSQKQTIHLNAESSLLLIDWMSAGRHTSGERWAFDSYSSRIEVLVDQHELLHESLWLSSEAGMGALAERLGRFNLLAVAVLIGPKVHAAVQRLLAELKQQETTRHPQLLAVGSPLGESGAVLRIGGVSIEQVGCTLRQCCRFLDALLGDNPWLRKW